MVAQAIHAAGESANGGVPSGTYAVALAAKDELHLHSIRQRLINHGIDHVAIHEPDPPHHGAMVAIGLHPAPRRLVRKGVSNLPLIK